MIGNLFNKGIAFLTVPIFTRILSTSDYGIINTYNSWIAIITMIIGFALHMSIRTAYIDYRERIDDFLAATVSFVLYSGLAISLFILTCAYLCRVNLSLSLIVLCLLQGLSSALIEDYSMYLMMHYRYKFRTALMILPNLISVTLSIIIIKFIISENAYMGRIVPTAMVMVFFGCIVCFQVYKRSKMFFNKEYIKYGLSISMPLILHGIALNILSQSDRTMITLLADSSQTGIYSLIHNFGLIATVITTSLEGIWVPWFMGKLKDRKISEINNAARNYVELMTTAMISVILVGPEVVKILAPEKYWDGIVIVPCIVLANYFIFVYTLYVNVEHYYKRTKYISFNTLIAACTNVLLNFLLIPIWGYKGAALTTVVSYILAFVLHSSYSKKLEDALYPMKFFVRPLFKILSCTIIFYFLIDRALFRWLLCILYILVVAYVNRKIILGYLKSR